MEDLPISSAVVAIQLEVEVVEALALAAVHFIQSLAHSCLLVEHGAVQTEELDVSDLSCNTTCCLLTYITTVKCAGRVILSLITSKKPWEQGGRIPINNVFNVVPNL